MSPGKIVSERPSRRGEGPEVKAIPEAELIAKAMAGDSAAAGEFFARHFPYLRLMARRVATSPDRAEDLLAGAMARLLELWKRGEGPAENVLTYLVAAMRNRQIDEHRSPRAREAWVEELPESSLPSIPESLQSVELHSEFDLVRRAFDRLSADSQRALREVVVNGRPPREVASELGRSAGAVSTLVTRSKTALRRELLVVMLGEGREECAVNAEALPSQVFDAPEAHPAGAAGVLHVLGCVDCRTVWNRYATLTSALGILPLLSVGLVVGSPAPAATAAATAGSVSDEGARVSSISSSKTAPAPSVAWAVGRPGNGSPLGTIGVSGAGAILARAGAVARAVVVGPAGVVVAVVTLIAGAGLLMAAWLGASGVLDLPGSSVVPIAAFDAPAAHLGTTVTPYPGGSVGLEVDFDIEADEWSLVSFSIALPDTVRIVAASTGWSCPMDDGGARCTFDGKVPGSSRFTLVAAGGMPDDGEYLVQVEALAEGVTTTGFSWGPLPTPEQTPTPAPTP